MKIPGKLPINTIQQNFPTLAAQQLMQLSQSIGLATQSVVSIDVKKLDTGFDKAHSIRLVKWVEPYSIGGINYSLFYSEVDHNYKVGDRIFIEGGYYDSDTFIQNNKYKKRADGYKVLYVDRCKIVLEIEYVGIFPTNVEEIDNFTKIYVASTQHEFDYYCQVLTMRQDDGIINNKFDLGMNNFLFLNGTFSITGNTYQRLTGFATDQSVSTTYSSYGNSFMYRGMSGSNNYFVDITNDVISDNYTNYLNIGYTQSLSGFYNNGKIRIMNGDFTSGGTLFKNGYFYYYDTVNNIWKIDKSYTPTIITKHNFRDGVFSKGEFNQGLYGQHHKKISYSGDNIKWNLGTVLNVTWLSGVLDSTIISPTSSFTIFDRTELPQIRANAVNNGGSGYNYVFDVDFVGGDVINGNIFNMAVVYGTNSTVDSALENYLAGQSTTYSINISGGVYYNSDLLFASVSNSTLISSYAFNSYLNNCKAVNSEVEASVFINSTWLSNTDVKIQDYEESNITWYDRGTTSVSYKMYKFYVDETDFSKLREFQVFYFQDLGITLPSTEILNYFDDKFRADNYIQTYDTVGQKLEREVLVQLSTKEENRNSPGIISTGGTVSMKPNSIALPSIDIFISGGQDFDYLTSTSSYPRDITSSGDQTIDISQSYILNSDFISGLFINSKWVTGNYFNYNEDYSFTSYNGYTASMTASTGELRLPIGGQKRQDIIGNTSSVSEIAFVNGLYYDSTLNISNTGTNLVKLPDTYKINSISSGTQSRFIDLQDIMTQSVINNLNNFNSQKYLITKNANNRYNYIHPTKFQNSVILGGIFRRAYFQNCQFDSTEFDVSDRDLNNFTNKRKLLLSDIIFADNNNLVKNGLVQYSHFINGSDNWIGGIFHQGVWNTATFSYSKGITSSLVFIGDNSFKGGIFRSGTWVNGHFDNGLFYKNKFNVVGTTSSVLNTLDVYYYDNVTDNKTRLSWQNGIFNNGDFERSSFENGEFSGGNFYDSNFLTGFADGGNFGKTNIPYQQSRIWTGTFSGINVINAEFLSQNPFGLTASSIVWNTGVFNAGIFGVYMTGSYTSSYPSKSQWKDGTFNNGVFTDIAYWENGVFNNGKFTSYYGEFDGQSLTPFDYISISSQSFAWQDGKFNDGEFGNGYTGSNSTWNTGEFNGGKFKGRYWRNGIFTRGQFQGSATYSTDIDNYNKFILGFNTDYYGYWQDGFVSKNKDKFIKDQKIYSEIERVSTQKKKSPDILFQNMLWNSGTFSNFDAEMNNSIWVNGTFQDGYFSNSTFNPYINLADISKFYVSGGGTISNILGTLYYSSTSPFNIVGQTNTVQQGQLYTMVLDISSNIGATIVYPSAISIPSNSTGIFSFTFSASSNDCGFLIGSGTVSFSKITLYPGTYSGFRTTDTCIWENGEAFSSDFYLSKWKQGVFDSYATSSQGNAWGIIWQDGITKYMNANNVLWERGTWKNGNWNGSPFIQISTYSVPTVYPGFASDIINNIMLYASQSLSSTFNSTYLYWDKLHMNDTFTFSDGSYVYDDVTNNELFTMSQDPHIGSTISLPNNIDYVDNQTLFVNKNYDFIDTSYWVYGATPSNPAIGSSIFGGQYIFYDFTSGTASDMLIQNGILIPGQTYNVVIDVPFNAGIGLQIGSRTSQSAFGSIGETGIISKTFVAEDGDLLLTVSCSSGGLFLMNSLKVCVNLNTRFGNGQFLTGIWENGIWNEGWRDDLTVIYCDNLSTFTGISKNKAYKNNVWTWTFQLNVPNVGAQSNGLITDFNIGDKVSVGNIVTIDINGNRRLIRDCLSIVDINTDNINNSTSLTLEVNINFPIRSIEKDSDNHLIYVTRNVWLNGVFLNGYFGNGVWSNGLFRGYPFITKMSDSHWVDGVFKGGRFSGITSSYVNDINVTIPYNTGLIQKFDFYDENVSGEAFKFKYNSWIDVVYYETEGVNINKSNNAYKQTPLGFTTSFVENNYYGYPTVDVLESNSTLRNGYDLNSRTYRLGMKWKEYTNYLSVGGTFLDTNQITYHNYSPYSTSGLGVSNFLNDGWTFSYLNDVDGFASATNSIVSNVGSYDSEWLYISGGRSGVQQSPFDDNINFTLDIFNNTNISIESLRYSFIEIEAQNLNFTQSSGGIAEPIVFYNNYPATYSIAAINTLFNGSNITIPINQIGTSSVSKQREYFFNKKDLQMLIFAGPTYSIRIKNMRMVETDMIPFTQIASNSIKFKTISTWDTTPTVTNPATSDPSPFTHPYPGQWELALPIGQTSIYSYPGNLQTILNPLNEPTWDNMYLVGSGGGGLSYINEEVVAPYTAKAPDINYGDLSFNYIKSANVTITDINNITV